MRPGLRGSKTYICGFKFSDVRRLFVSLTFLFLLVGCFEQGDCLLSNSNLMKVSLKKFSDKSTASVTFNSITIAGEIPLTYTAAQSSLALPLNPESTETQIIFDYKITGGSRKDTLNISYRNESIVLSPDCGVYQYQRDLAISKNTFGADSVRLVNNQVNLKISLNVEIYF